MAPLATKCDESPASAVAQRLLAAAPGLIQALRPGTTFNGVTMAHRSTHGDDSRWMTCEGVEGADRYGHATSLPTGL